METGAIVIYILVFLCSPLVPVHPTGEKKISKNTNALSPQNSWPNERRVVIILILY